jgi:valyl-tRNA synthetase
MSKSLGTGIDPMDLIEKYGADATRFGIIWQNMGTQDVHWSEEHVMAGKKFANKLWNIARFVLLKTGESFDPQRSRTLTIEQNKALLEKLDAVMRKTNTELDAYDFGQAIHALYDFVWHDFADVYVEYSKKEESDETKQVLAYALVTILKLLHPFMPFVTEEIWSKLPIEQKRLLLVEEWPVSAVTADRI